MTGHAGPITTTRARANDEHDHPGPLQGRHVECGTEPADRYAAQLLATLGADAAPCNGPVDPADVARDWAQSGLLPLIGHPDGPPQIGPAALASCADGALRALRAIADQPCLPGIAGAQLLSERAACLGLQRRGQISAGGTCRLLRAADDWIAVNLARAIDWELLPAWLESDAAFTAWDALAAALRGRCAAPLVERGRLIGLPVATASDTPTAAGWFRLHRLGARKSRRANPASPLVVDLSSLWAGPLCGHLLQQTGARVIKVESLQRPDGARGGNREFFDLLNADKASVALDFGSDAGRRQLRELLRHADIVIEASRPRALAQLGVDAEALVDARPGLVWIGITGYGRSEPNAQWVAFGDDAGIAAGAAVGDPPVFCGDALGDPLTGLHAALAGLVHWQAGVGALLDVSLCQVTAHCLRALSAPPGNVVHEDGRWLLASGERRWPIAAPQLRTHHKTAPEFGADTARILEEFAIPC